MTEASYSLNTTYRISPKTSHADLTARDDAWRKRKLDLAFRHQFRHADDYILITLRSIDHASAVLAKILVRYRILLGELVLLDDSSAGCATVH